MWQNETTSEMKRVGLYIRVSTEDQATEWTSLESQERILKAFVEANSDKGWITNDALLYKDEGVSGALPAIDRPWLSRLMKDVLNGGLDIEYIEIRESFLERLNFSKNIMFSFVQNLNDSMFLLLQGNWHLLFLGLLESLNAIRLHPDAN